MRGSEREGGCAVKKMMGDCENITGRGLKGHYGCVNACAV